MSALLKIAELSIFGLILENRILAQLMAHGSIKEGKVFRHAFLEFPEREIGDLRESEEETIRYFEDRFTLVEKEVAELEEKITDATNKGSYWMKVLHLKETLPQKDALGDYEPLWQKLCELEELLAKQINQNRQKNLDIKQALIAELAEVTQSSEWKSTSEAVKTIQQKWLKTGAVPDEEKEKLETLFKTLTQNFYDRRAAFYADLEQMMVEKEALYVAFLEKAEKELKGISVAKMKPVTDALREEWKGLGRIKREKQNEFWAQFQAITKKAWKEGKKQQKSVQKTDHAANKKNKEEFIEKLKQLNESLEPDVNLDTLKKEWKELGSVNKKDSQPLHEAYLLQYNLLSEKQFLKGMLLKRLKGRDKGADARKLRQRILRDLLDRDTRELNAFKENLEKFSTKGNFQDMLGNKLEQQERKVKVKKLILDQVRTAK